MNDVEAMTDAELDAAIDAANSIVTKLPPPLDCAAAQQTGDRVGSTQDPKGLGRPFRTGTYRGQGRLEVVLGLVKNGVSLADSDKLVAQMREQIVETARNHPTVKLWRSAIAEKAAHERTARIARAAAEDAAARRADLVARGGGDNLAQQLRDLDMKATTARAATAEAEELIRFAAEAVAARRKEVMRQ